MRWWVWPLRLVGLLVLSLLISAGWLLRDEIAARVRPRVEQISEQVSEQVVERVQGDAGVPRARDQARARDKVDSLHGWAADSILLTPRETAVLIHDWIPAKARRRLDSLQVELGEGRVTVGALLETASIPAEVLGPLAGALDPWERVAVAGAVVVTTPGQAEWRVDALTLRGFTLPEAASRELVSRALPGTHNGAILLALPDGIADLRIRSTGVALYRKET